jgi:Ca2+-transporting ATPase
MSSASKQAASSTGIQALSARDVYKTLGSDPSGLSTNEASTRQEKQDKNLLKTTKGRSPVLVFLSNFAHLMALLLWAAGIIAFIAGLPQLGVAIWFVNVINGCFSFWQERQANKVTDALKKMLPSSTSVMRDGHGTKVLAEDLVSSDVMLFAEGDKISADGRVVAASDLQVNQSTLTGESNPVRKTNDAVLEEEGGRFIVLGDPTEACLLGPCKPGCHDPWV